MELEKKCAVAKKPSAAIKLVVAREFKFVAEKFRKADQMTYVIAVETVTELTLEAIFKLENIKPFLFK